MPAASASRAIHMYVLNGSKQVLLKHPDGNGVGARISHPLHVLAHMSWNQRIRMCPEVVGVDEHESPPFGK